MANNEPANDSAFDFPEPTLEAKVERLNLWATHYYVHSAAPVENGEPLLDKSGNELGPELTARDFCLAAVEGTVRVTGPDSAVYNYASHATIAQVDCSTFVPGLPDNIKAALGKSRWEIAKGPFGSGVKGMILVPFRTIAVDPAHLPYESLIFIPQARGKEIKLPSGSLAIHDGYFFAADTGSAIKQNHIDVFGGISNHNPFPEFIKSNSAKTFEAFRINDPSIATALRRLHGAAEKLDPDVVL